VSRRRVKPGVWIKRLDEVPVVPPEEAGTAVLAIGGRRTGRFTSSWRAEHFENVPTADD
jgi:hypothetical protein